MTHANTAPRITRDSLMTLEAYAKARPEFRARVLEHKRPRTVHLGEHVTLVFEDELTLRYQIQEMLRIEKTFEEAGIQDELDAYNPLVPDGTNFKATMLIEYEDVAERQRALARLKGIEDRVWVQVEGASRVLAIADEDLERENAQKTSAVHFLRFELTPHGQVRAVDFRTAIACGAATRAYSARRSTSARSRGAVAAQAAAAASAAATAARPSSTEPSETAASTAPVAGSATSKRRSSEAGVGLPSIHRSRGRSGMSSGMAALESVRVVLAAVVGGQ